MKKILILTPILVLFIQAITFQSCNNDSDNLNLDMRLFGQWVYTDSNSDIYAWTFYEDGSCIQTVPTGNYDWQWNIEDDQLKLYIDGGIPAYKTYKIEENKLYFWEESMQIWSLPYIKQ